MVYGLIVLLLSIWQVPGTIGVRYSLLVVLLLVSLVLCFGRPLANKPSFGLGVALASF